MTAEKKIQAVCKRVAALLRQERERQNLSMTVLAERSGLSQPSVSYIERGMRIPGLDTLLSIAGTLGVELSEIIAMAVKPASRGKA